MRASETGAARKSVTTSRNPRFSMHSAAEAEDGGGICGENGQTGRFLFFWKDRLNKY